MKWVVNIDPGAEKKFKRQVAFHDIQEDGKEARVTYSVTFIELGLNETREIMSDEDGGDLAERQATLLRRVLADVSGLYGADGDPKAEYEFSEALVDYLVDRPKAAAAMVSEYFDAIKYDQAKENRRKNS